MKLLHALPPNNFGGLEEEFSEYERSAATVLLIPFDSTQTFVSGARKGPSAIVNASRFIELYDDEMDSEPYKKGISTLEEIEPVRGNSKETLERIERVYERIVYDRKLPVMLGGEHTISIAGVKCFKKVSDDFSVLVLDAHADLRDELEGSAFSHACTSRRIWEINQSMTLVGVRSMGREEKKFAKQNEVPVFNASRITEESVESLLSLLKEKVYISIDFDCLDSGIFPAVGNPEPNGFSYSDVINLLKAICREKKVIAMDFTEFTPINGFHACDCLAAKLVYRSIGYALQGTKKE